MKKHVDQLVDQRHVQTLKERKTKHSKESKLKSKCNRSIRVFSKFHELINFWRNIKLAKWLESIATITRNRVVQCCKMFKKMIEKCCKLSRIVSFVGQVLLIKLMAWKLDLCQVNDIYKRSFGNKISRFQTDRWSSSLTFVQCDGMCATRSFQKYNVQ